MYDCCCSGACAITKDSCADLLLQIITVRRVPITCTTAAAVLHVTHSIYDIDSSAALRTVALLQITMVRQVPFMCTAVLHMTHSQAFTLVQHCLWGIT